MRKKRVGVVDILAKSPSSHSYSRMLRVNNMSIMPQIVAVWCEEDGHDVHYAYHDGPYLLKGGIPDDLDIIFINAFSQCAQLAYALSAYYRSKGIATALGGLHARSYPEDAVNYFDYVVGFADKSLISEIVQESAPHRPVGQHLYRSSQPSELPSLRQRWKYVELALEEAKIIRMIPMLGSVGCPYTCSFCIDANVDYQALDLETIKEDLRFIRKLKMPRSIVIWHDPNFGIRFNDILGTIEEAIPPGSLKFLAECSLSVLKEDNLIRLRKNGFKIIMPGIESWYDMGDKSRARNIRGMEKVKRVADQLNTIQSYIPYVQANLIFGLDNDVGSEPFELTKKFLDLAPGIYPHFALLTSFGRNAELNLGYQGENRVLGTPFHFLNLFHAMNVTPKNYTWSHYCPVKRFSNLYN